MQGRVLIERVESYVYTYRTIQDDCSCLREKKKYDIPFDKDI